MSTDQAQQHSYHAIDAITIQSFDEIDQLDRIAPAWNALALESVHRSPVHSHAWLASWLDVYCRQGEWLVVTAHQGDQLLAVLPLVKKSAGRFGISYKYFQLPGNHQTISVDGLVKVGHEAVLQQLYDHIFAQHPHCLCIYYQRIDAVSPTLEWVLSNKPHHVAARVEATGGAVEIAGDYEDYVKSLKKNFRSSLKRFRNRLQDEQNVTFTYAEDAFDAEAFAAFLQSEHSGWKGEQGTSILSNDEDVVFFRTLGQRLAAVGWLSLQSLRSDSGVLAANFAVNFNRTTLLWKLGYSDQHAKISPGTLLMDDLLSRRFAAGFTRVDLLTHEDWYNNWGMIFRPFYDLRVFRPGLTGRTAAALVRTRYQLAKVKQALAALLKK